MVKFRVVLSLLVLVGLLTATAPASAQVNANGFSFGSSFIGSRVLDGDRYLLTVFGFHADNSGVSLIDVKCPINNPINNLANVCSDLMDVGTEFQAMTGGPPDAFSDHPNHYVLSSVGIGFPIIVSFSPESLDSETWPAAARKGLRPRLFGEIRGVAAA